MEEETYPLTELDQIANGEYLLMFKAMLHYLPPGSSHIFAFFIKILELQNVEAYYKRHKSEELHAMAFSSPSPTELLQTLTRFCPSSQRESFRQFLNIMETIQMLETMQDMFGGEYSYGESEQPETGNSGTVCEETDFTTTGPVLLDERQPSCGDRPDEAADADVHVRSGSEQKSE